MPRSTMRLQYFIGRVTLRQCVEEHDEATCAAGFVFEVSEVRQNAIEHQHRLWLGARRAKRTLHFGYLLTTITTKSRHYAARSNTIRHFYTYQSIGCGTPIGIARFPKSKG